MYHFLQKFHSGWAYLALLLLVFAVIYSFIGFLQKHGFKLFGYYRIVAGIILLILIITGFIDK